MPTVLVVDDDEDNLLLIAVSLERMAEWRILRASNGWDAIKLARSASPDAILLDLIMPGLDGVTTFEALQSDLATQSIPVILLTAMPRVGSAQVWDDLDFAGVVTKPFSAKSLPTRVAAILGWAPPAELQSGLTTQP